MRTSRRSSALAVIAMSCLSVSPFIAATAVIAGDSADDVARILMPDLNKFETAYRKAKEAAEREGPAGPGGRSRSWKTKPEERTRGYHSDVPKLQNKVRERRVDPTPAAVPVPVEPKVVKQTVASKSYSTAKITFELNSDVITPSGQFVLNNTIIPALQKVRSYVVERTRAWGNDAPQTEFSVAGHTDATGSDDYNQALSERRAIAVCNYIQSHGYSGKLTCVGHGKRQLALPGEPHAAANRRVEITGVVVTTSEVASN